VYTNDEQNEIAYYKRAAEELRSYYDGLVGQLAKADLTNSLQETRITKLLEKVKTLQKHLNHLRLENDALRSVVPADCDLDIPSSAEGFEAETSEGVVDRPPLPELELDPYTELKAPHF
jgi:hypothetical protein